MGSVLFDREALRPLIKEVIKETVAEINGQSTNDSRIAYSEAEAAQMIGLTQRQLAEERRDGRIQASQTRGGRIRYLKSDLVEYLRSRRWTNNSSSKQ